jgi:hypothetical protein
VFERDESAPSPPPLVWMLSGVWRSLRVVVDTTSPLVATVESSK